MLLRLIGKGKVALRRERERDFRDGSLKRCRFGIALVMFATVHKFYSIMH